MIIDCGDSGCRFAPTKTGMRTNGGCSCYERAGFHPSAVLAAKEMLPELLRLRSRLADFELAAEEVRAALQGDGSLLGSTGRLVTLLGNAPLEHEHVGGDPQACESCGHTEGNPVHG